MRFEDTGGTFVFWLKEKKKDRVSNMPSLPGHDRNNILDLNLLLLKLRTKN